MLGGTSVPQPTNMDIKKDSIEARILSILRKQYPITINELQRQTRLSRSAIERVLRGLASRGIVCLEPLPDTTFVRLLRTDFRFIGRNPTQKTALKKIKPTEKKSKTSDDYEGMMYA